MNKKYAPLFALGLIIVALLVAKLSTKKITTTPVASNGKEDQTNGNVTRQSLFTQRPIKTESVAPKQIPPVAAESHYSIKDFETFTQIFKTELPQMKELRTQAKHSLHPGLIKTYSRSGKIARAAIRQPELRKTAYAALESCISLENYDTSIRAMCLRQHRKIREATGETSFNETIRFKKLPELNNLLQRSFDD